MPQVRILCTNQALDMRGGSESYLETIVPQLRQLGHDVELFCLRGGPVADRFRAAGYVVHDDAATLSSEYDVVHAQHASAALATRSVLPEVPMVFVSHSWVFDIEDPPLAAAPSAVVALNDLVAERIRASSLGESVPVHRLTQPVTISPMDRDRLALRDPPRAAVALSPRLATRVPALREACRRLGIELTVVGRDDAALEDPTRLMMRADIVCASGRTLLEALALGRAGFVYDETGCGGFVTADSYPALEACGFTDASSPPVTDLQRVLSGYDAMFGVVGRELVIRHHHAARHVAALVALYRSAGPPRVSTAPPDVLRQLAEVTQRLFAADLATRVAQWEAARLDARLVVLQDELDAMRRTASWRATAPLRRLARPGRPHRGSRDDLR